MNEDTSNDRYYFTEEHEWVRFEDDIGFVGLTNLAKRELGFIESIEIHTVGKDLIEDQVFGRIRTKKYLCKLIMPIRGKILESNVINYERLNNIDDDFDPTEWIVKISLSSPLGFKKLYSFEDYKTIKKGQMLHLVKYLLKK